MIYVIVLSHIQLLGKVILTFPSDRWLIVEDNLSSHHSRATRIALAAWPEIRILFLPKYACWLNLIAPWWKQLKSLALKGRRFETQAELETALWEALEYWNKHRYPEVKEYGQVGCKFAGHCPEVMDICREVDPPDVQVERRTVESYLYTENTDQALLEKQTRSIPDIS